MRRRYLFDTGIAQDYQAARGGVRFTGDAMRRPQFTLRALLVLMLAVACFFGGIRFERERRRREAEAAAKREHAVRVYPLVGPARFITLPDGTKHLQPVAVESE